MPEPARRFTSPPYDQFDDSDRVSDWGGDDLFTRMPRPRAVDDAPAPRFVPASATDEPGVRTGAPARALVLLDPPRERRDAAAVDQRSGRGDRRRASQPAHRRSVAPAEQLGGVAPAEHAGTFASAEHVGTFSPAANAGTFAPVEHAGTLAPVEHLGTVAPAEQLGTVAPEQVGLPVVAPMAVPQPGGRMTRVITGHPSGVPQPLPIVRSERRREPRTPAEWIGSRPERIVGWAFALGLILILIAITTADAATV